MDGKTAINTIMELLGNINKGYFNEYEEELDTIRQKMVENEELKKENEELKKENEELRKENEELKLENEDYFEQYEKSMYNTD